MNILLYTGITIAAVIGMEFMAWFTHKYIMHGVLWSWHEDHHQPHHEKEGFFEKTTFSFWFLLFLVPSATFWGFPPLIYGYYSSVSASLFTV